MDDKAMNYGNWKPSGPPPEIRENFNGLTIPVYWARVPEALIQEGELITELEYWHADCQEWKPVSTLGGADV